MINKPRKRRSAEDGCLEGQLLLAMPTMTDKRFRRAVIYMCRHSEEGAMGIIVNQLANDITFGELLGQLEMTGDGSEGGLPDGLSRQAVHVGGPVSSERGFVLHSGDFRVEDMTLAISDGIFLTASVDILKAIASGKGPKQSKLALGYSGWSAGQLEGEIQANGWLHCPADKSLVFGDDIDTIYERALSKIGVNPSFLASEAGHA